MSVVGSAECLSLSDLHCAQKKKVLRNAQTLTDPIFLRSQAPGRKNITVARNVGLHMLTVDFKSAISAAKNNLPRGRIHTASHLQSINIMRDAGETQSIVLSLWDPNPLRTRRGKTG